MQQNVESQLEVKTVTKAGAPVSDRIATVEAARDIYKRLGEAALGDAERRFRIKGQIDGRPPYDPTRLKEMGLGYITNVNFLELRATIDDRAGRRFSSYYEVPQLVSVKMTAVYDAASDVPDLGMVVAEEFTRLMKEDWDGFYPLMDLVGRESDSYGLGVAMFADEFDWRPEERHVSNFFPDPNAKVDLSKLSMFCYNGSLKVGELFRTISDEDVAKKAGWNVPAVRELLVRLYVKKENTTGADGGPMHGNAWEELEQRYRNNDYMLQIDELRDVDVAHVVYAQVDTGEIGHKILARSEGPVDKFLFEAPRRFKKMQNVLWCLPYNYGDGYIKSCRGIASYIEQHSDLSNRYLGSAFDAGRTAATLLVQPTNPAGYDRLTVVRQGILTVVDHRLKIEQSSFQPRINDLIALRRVSSELMQNNTRETKDMPEDPSYNPQPKTAEEVREVASRSARGENSQAVFYAIQLQKLYREIFRRLTNPDYVLSDYSYPGVGLALLFLRRCVERGVPLEMLLDLDAWRIQAMKPVGGGSPQARASADQAMMDIRGEADEKGRREIIRAYAAGKVGYDNVDRYFPVKTRDSIETNEHSIAALETSDFYSGSQGVVGSDQNHVIHFTVHAQPVMQIVQAVEEQGPEAVDPQKAVAFLSAALPHIEGHLQLLSKEPTRKQFVQQGVALLKKGIQALDVLKKLLEKMQAEQEKLQAEQEGQLADAQQKAFSAEQSLELAKAQMKQEVEVLRQQSLNAMRAQKTAEQMRINAERTANDVRLKQERQAADIEMLREKTEADVEAKRRKSEPAGP